MKKINYLFEKRYFFLSFFLLFFFFIQSSILYLHVYDGHHQGLMFSNAIDLIDGNRPYDEIFIQYGILTTVIHSLALLLFGESVYIINLTTLLFYYSSIFFIYLIIKKLTNDFLAFTGLMALVFNHPTPWLPWSNYISFFFIALAVCLFVYRNRYSSFLLGFFLSLATLSRQDYFVPIFSSLILFAVIFFTLKIKLLNLKLQEIFLGFFFPILLFFLYLFFHNNFFEWVIYIKLPLLYLDNSNSNIFSLIFNFINFFFIESLSNFIITPQYFLIFFILILNLISLLFFLKNKDIKLLFISILSIFLSILSLNLELFRLYTSVSFGIITSLYLIYKINSQDVKKILIFLVYSTSFFSIFFYPNGNNSNFKKTDTSNKYTFSKIDIFKYQKWPDEKIKPLNTVKRLRDNIVLNCPIIYSDNLTFDSYYANILGLKRTRLFPYVKSDRNGQFLDDFFNNNFEKKINIEIINQNIILLVSEDSQLLKNNRIIFTSKYSYKEINLNSIKDKPNIFKFYYPTKCYTKS